MNKNRYWKQVLHQQCRTNEIIFVFKHYTRPHTPNKRKERKTATNACTTKLCVHEIQSITLWREKSTFGEIKIAPSVSSTLYNVYGAVECETNYGYCSISYFVYM